MDLGVVVGLGVGVGGTGTEAGPRTLARFSVFFKSNASLRDWGCL